MGRCQIFRGLAEEVPERFGPSVVTIGNFDGVHCGHRWTIGEAVRRARELGVQAVGVTFDPHPVRVLRPEVAPKLLTPLPEKLELLAATGLDAVVVLEFDEALARMAAREFAVEILCRRCGIVELHEGENFRFGYRAEGGIETLLELGREFGFRTVSYPPLCLRGGAVSSSRVRGLVEQGRVSEARALLGRAFAVRSRPASGRGYGTKYAVPTINLAPYPELLPAHGVYCTSLRVGDRVFAGVTNVGNRPTFGADSFAVETHLLDFEPVSLSEETELELTFFLRLRGEMRWPSPEALKVQIGRDVARARRFFGLRGVLGGEQ